ncbi:MAG: NAAT family transporter [Proteobacteria bacterium]|nr:NAAT family transporter [Pseudomonadota bacterium]
MEITTAATLLFLTMDPLGNIPVFLSVLDKVAPERRTRVVIRELLLALIILLLFLYFGSNILSTMHLSQESIQVAGGIILFLIALKMVFPVARSAQIEEEINGEPLLVPLAIPMVAGPSAIATLLIISNDEPSRMLDWTLAVVIAWAASSMILLPANKLKKVLGRRGLIATERLMGMLLVAISVQMLLDGIAGFMQHNG